jgi:hypothetical protein
MGWRDRDYAKWTDEERRRFLGSSATAASSPRATGTTTGASRARSPRSVFRAGTGLAIAASAGLFALGQLPRGHPLLSQLHVPLPALRHLGQKPAAAPTVTRIALPRSAAVGSFLALQGQLPAGESGTVSVEGASVRPPWHLLAAVPAKDGAYTARFQLTRKGLFHLRVTYPDGHRSTGQIRVR